jgi:hypothetical protein
MRAYTDTLPDRVTVALSARNLRDLAQQLEDGGTPLLQRRQEDGTHVVIVVESDPLHYAQRPDALEAYGLAPAERA